MILKESKRIQKNPQDSKEGKYSYKALNCSNLMVKKAKKANVPSESPQFKELDVPTLLGRLKILRNVPKDSIDL